MKPSAPFLNLCSYALCRHLRMGLPRVEACLLSTQACLREVSLLLRIAPEHRRGELHLSPHADGEDATELVGADSSGVSLLHQGASRSPTFAA